MKTIINLYKLSTLFVCLLLGVDLIPPVGGIDAMGAQWLYLSIVNVFAVLFILIFRRHFKEAFSSLFSNWITYSLVGFFLLCGLSFFFAINKVESLVVYSRLTITVVSFFVFGIFMHMRSINFFCRVISILALIQCVVIILNLLMDVGTVSMDTLISNLNGFDGNKNILAASLIVKLPFIAFLVTEGRFKHCLTLFAVTFLIFILNARAAYISLIFQAVYYLFFYFRRRNVLFALFIPLMVAFMLSQAFFIRYSDGGGYGVVTKRVKTIVSDAYNGNERFYYWGNAISCIKDHPFGIGIGNWKLAALPYEANHFDYFKNSKHVHNDFLQITAEVGILATIAFVSIFFFAFRYGRNFGMLCVAGYMVDAFFNFPAERPVMQIYFVFGLSVIVLLNKVVFFSRVGTFNRWLYIGAFLTVSALYVSICAYKSMRIQKHTFYEFGQPEVSHVDLDFPAIPNLGEDNIPVDVEKAWYLYKGEHYQQALYYLNRSEKVNPYNMANEWVKACVYNKMGQKDSVEYYMRKGKLTRPNNTLFNHQ